MQVALTIIGEELKQVELQFRKDLQSDVPLIRKVGEYVLSSGGKRVRPALLLLAARLSGYTGDKAVLWPVLSNLSTRRPCCTMMSLTARRYGVVSPLPIRCGAMRHQFWLVIF